MTQVLSFPLSSSLPEASWHRSTALGLAVAGNALLLMLLSLPRDDSFNPYLPELEEPAPDIPEVVTRAQPTPMPPPPLPRLPERPPQTHEAVIRPIVEQATSTQVVAAVAPPAESTLGSSAAVATTVSAAPSPPADLSVGYDVAPPPPYPLIARRQGLQGTVILRVLVGADGRPREVQIARSSGHRELDRAAERQVLARWRFVPASRDGQPIEAWARVPLQFTLQRG